MNQFGSLFVGIGDDGRLPAVGSGDFAGIGKPLELHFAQNNKRRIKMKYKLSLQLFVDAELEADTPNQAKAKAIVYIENCGFLHVSGIRLFIENVEVTGIFDEGYNALLED